MSLEDQTGTAAERWDQPFIMEEKHEQHRRVRWLIETTNLLVRFQTTRSKLKLAAESVVAVALVAVMFVFFGSWGIVVAAAAIFLRELLLTLVIEVLVHVILKHWKVA